MILNYTDYSYFTVLPNQTEEYKFLVSDIETALEIKLDYERLQEIFREFYIYVDPIQMDLLKRGYLTFDLWRDLIFILTDHWVNTRGGTLETPEEFLETLTDQQKKVEEFKVLFLLQGCPEEDFELIHQLTLIYWEAILEDKGFDYVYKVYSKVLEKVEDSQKMLEAINLTLRDLNNLTLHPHEIIKKSINSLTH